MVGPRADRQVRAPPTGTSGTVMSGVASSGQAARPIVHPWQMTSPRFGSVNVVVADVSASAQVPRCARARARTHAARLGFAPPQLRGGRIRVRCRSRQSVVRSMVGRSARRVRPGCCRQPARRRSRGRRPAPPTSHRTRSPRAEDAVGCVLGGSLLGRARTRSRLRGLHERARCHASVGPAPDHSLRVTTCPRRPDLWRCAASLDARSDALGAAISAARCGGNAARPGVNHEHAGSSRRRALR